MLEPAVECLGRAVAGSGSVEVGQDIGGTLLQRPAQLGDLDQRLRYAGADRVDELDHQLPATAPVLVAVGGDHALVDAPGGFDLDVGLVGEQRAQPVDLLVGEQIGARGQGATCGVERIALHAAVPVDGLLDPASALVECLTGQPRDVEGVHHGQRVGQLLNDGGLEAGEPVHRDDLHAVAPVLGPFGEPGLEGLLRAALDHVEQPRGSGAVADRGEIDDHRDVLVAAAGVPPHVLVHAEHVDAVEPVLVVDQHALPFGQDGVVGSVPRDPQPFGDPGDGEVLDHDPFQCPPQTPARQLRPRLCRGAGVLAPHVAAAGAPVAAHDDFQDGGTPPQRFVREPTNDAVAGPALASAAAAPLVGLDDPTREHRPIRLKALPDRFEPKLIESAERGQVRAGEARRGGSVRHVGVFRVDGVGTSILGRPRPPSRDRRAPTTSHHRYTLVWEEPDWTSTIRPIVDAHPAFRPTFKEIAHTSAADVAAFISAHPGRDLGLVLTTNKLPAAMLSSLLAGASVRLFSTTSGAHTLASALGSTVSINDNFNAQARNADYSGSEWLGTNHIGNAAPGSVGFSDYTILPSSFSASGGPVGAAAIHLTFQEADDSFWVQHFISDERDRNVGTFSSKMLEAVAHIEAQIAATPARFAITPPVNDYLHNLATGTGTNPSNNKSRQISHHLHVVANYLGLP